MSQSAVEDGQEGQEVTAASYQDDEEDVEDGRHPGGLLSQHLGLTALSVLQPDWSLQVRNTTFISDCNKMSGS